MAKQKSKAVTEDDLKQKLDDLLSRRRGPREEKEEHTKKPTKFVVDYKDDKGNLTSRWTYDLKKQPNGPILVENFGPEFDKKPKKS